MRAADNHITKMLIHVAVNSVENNTLYIIYNKRKKTCFRLIYVRLQAHGHKLYEDVLCYVEGTA